MAKEIRGKIHAGRTCRGLSRIGYSSANAICDILDNSVSHNAKHCQINIHKINPDFKDARVGNIKQIEICDDGDGMDHDALIRAIDIGSGDEDYTEDTLSKFGLGLKAASFSQGDVLTVISGKDNEFSKVSVDIREQKEDYIIWEHELTEADMKCIDTYCPDGHGTIVQISEIHNKELPSIKKIMEMLKDGNRRLGAIYYYYIKSGISIKLGDDEVEPFDVLFEEEANRNGDLYEYDWDGKTVRWIERGETLSFEDNEGNVSSATVQVTQLVHPPTMGLTDESGQANARKKYNIDSGQYGFYIYRNKRMIRWADMLGTLSQSAYLYGFRGKILITSDADEVFNIDVTKSHVELSGDLFDQVDDLCKNWSSKSIKAWKHAAKAVKRATSGNPTERTNKILEQDDIDDDLAFEGLPTEEEEKERQHRSEEIKESHKKKVIEETKAIIAEESLPRDTSEITDDEAEKKIEEETSKDEKVLKVPLINDNMLFEPYYDPTNHHMVRINLAHRFSQLVYDDNSENADLQILFELLMYKMSEAEVRLEKNFAKYKREDIEEIITEYRRYFSELLTTLCRSEKKLLPPIGDSYE